MNRAFQIGRGTAVWLVAICWLLVVVSAPAGIPWRCAAAADEPSGAYRTWTAAAGGVRIEARMLQANDTHVQLQRRDNGQIIAVELSKLSRGDVEYVRAQSKPAPGGVGQPNDGAITAESIQRMANQQPTAKQALAIYRLYLSFPGIAPREKELARLKMAYWEQAAASDLQRIGSKWLSPAAIKQLRADEAELFAEANRLYNAGNFEQAQEKFLAASRLAPDGIRSDFRLGVLSALIKRDAPQAGKYFDKCIKRRIRQRDELTPSQTANLIASYNNYAITQMRDRKYTSAIKYWSNALALGPPAPEIVQNLGRLSYLGEPEVRTRLGRKATVALTANNRRRASEFYSTSSRSITGATFDRNRGWLYMPFVAETDDASTAAGPSEVMDLPRMRVVGYASGFVVGPNYVLTGARVAKDADACYVVDLGRSEKLLPADFKFADESDLGLALVHCKSLEATPVGFAQSSPAGGAEVRLLGFPLPKNLRTSLLAVKGTITAVPPHDGLGGVFAAYQDHLLYDTAIDAQFGGGPACDAAGNVVAVNTPVFLAGAGGRGYAAGVPAGRVVSFLKTHLPSYDPSRFTRSNTVGTWDNTVARVGASTVQIILLKNPIRVAGSDEFDDSGSGGAYEDRWCMACHGSRQQECTNRKCSNGTVKAFRYETQRFTDGTSVTTRVQYRLTCGTCSGGGKVSCRYCTNGVDPSFGY